MSARERAVEAGALALAERYINWTWSMERWREVAAIVLDAPPIGVDHTIVHILAAHLYRSPYNGRAASCSCGVRIDRTGGLAAHRYREHVAAEIARGGASPDTKENTEP